MTNTNYLYEAMRKFQQARNAAQETYLQTMKHYESAKGTEYYSDQQEKAAKARAEAVEAARAACIQTVNNALACMRSAIDRKGMTAPTDEQLRILQLLKMRDVREITPAELQAAAVSMNGNSAALAVVQAIANDKMEARAQDEKDGKPLQAPYYAPNFLALSTDGLPAAQATKALDSLQEICRTIIHGDGASRAAALAAKYQQRRQGTPYNPDDLPRERDYESEQEFFERYMIATPFEAFAKTVNGAGE